MWPLEVMQHWSRSTRRMSDLHPWRSWNLTVQSHGWPGLETAIVLIWGLEAVLDVTVVAICQQLWCYGSVSPSFLQLFGTSEGKRFGHASLQKFSLGYTCTSTFPQEEAWPLSQQKKPLIEILFSGIQPLWERIQTSTLKNSYHIPMGSRWPILNC